MQSTEQVTNTDADLFNQYDRNSDQQWDRDEFNTSMGESQVFIDRHADGEGTVNQEEFSQGTFNNWDTNQDGNLSSDEYNMYHNNTGTLTDTTGTGMSNDDGLQTTAISLTHVAQHADG